MQCACNYTDTSMNGSNLNVVAWMAAEQSGPLELRPHAAVVLNVAPHMVESPIDPKCEAPAPPAPSIGRVRRYHVVPHLLVEYWALLVRGKWIWEGFFLLCESNSTAEVGYSIFRISLEAFRLF